MQHLDRAQQLQIGSRGDVVISLKPLKELFGLLLHPQLHVSAEDHEALDGFLIGDLFDQPDVGLRGRSQGFFRPRQEPVDGRAIDHRWEGPDSFTEGLSDRREAQDHV